jgi:hypothetical protein
MKLFRLALALGACGAFAGAASADAAPPSCTGPDCVSAIAFADPATVHATRGPDGTTHVTWSTLGEVTEPLAQPITIEQAAQQAEREAAAHGLLFTADQPGTIDGATAARAGRRAKAHRGSARAAWAVGYTTCNTNAYAPWRVVIDSYWSHLHIASDQTCYGYVSQNWVAVHEHRDGTYLGGSTGVSFGSGAVTTASTFVNCHVAGDHVWDNWSHFYTYDTNGVYHSGPMGIFAAMVSYRCY